MKKFKLINPNFGSLHSNRNDCPFIQETWDREGNDISDISDYNQFNFKENYIKDSEELPF